MILKTVHLVIWWHNQNLRFWFWWYSIDENSYESILVYDILYKTLIGAKPLHIRLNKTDGFIRVYYETRYLVFFGLEKWWSHLQHVQIYYMPKRVVLPTLFFIIMQRSKPIHIAFASKKHIDFV